MIRIQLYLPKEEHTLLTHLARERNKPMAEVIRTFIKSGLAKETSIDKSGKRAMIAIAGLKQTGGPIDLSANLDHYLYGRTKKNK